MQQQAVVVTDLYIKTEIGNEKVTLKDKLDRGKNM